MRGREIELLRCLEMLLRTRDYGHDRNRWAFSAWRYEG